MTFTLLHDSPARRDDYISLTGSNTFPLSFCGTRWIEDAKVADQLINTWENVTSFCEKLPKSKQPSCKSFASVQSAVDDKFIVAKLQFFSFVASLFKPFLPVYQTYWPALPFMYGDLIDIARNLQLFIKLDALNKCTSGTAFKELNLTKKDNILSQKKLNIGFPTEPTITEKVRKDLVTDGEVSEFKKQILKLLAATAKKLFERSPL